jgi:cysteine desulfurase/selenocysteine lyase
VRVLRLADEPSSAVVSIHVPGVEPSLIGAILDSEFNIAVRTGYLCAARIHRALGTDPGGVTRFSIGPFNTPDEIEATIAAVGEIITSVR